MNVFPHGHQRVQTMLESHYLESHVTGGQDENTNSVKTQTQVTDQHSKTKTTQNNRQHARIMGMNLSRKSDYCLFRSFRLLVWHIMNGNSQKQVDKEDGM